MVDNVWIYENSLTFAIDFYLKPGKKDLVDLGFSFIFAYLLLTKYRYHELLQKYVVNT